MDKSNRGVKMFNSIVNAISILIVPDARIKNQHCRKNHIFADAVDYFTRFTVFTEKKFGHMLISSSARGQKNLNV